MDLLPVPSSLLWGQEYVEGPQTKVTGLRPCGDWLVPGEWCGQAVGGRYRCCDSPGLLETRKQPITETTWQERWLVPGGDKQTNRRQARETNRPNK